MTSLALLQLVSPALPIGAFAWSQGLESAFDLGWVSDEVTLGEWLAGVLEDGLTRCDLPALARLYDAWQAGDAALYDNRVSAAPFASSFVFFRSFKEAVHMYRC